MERKIRKIIVILMLLAITTNVQAITSNDVTYDNNGTTENLTESLDTLYNELKKYKTGGSVEANQMLAGVSGYSKGVLVTGTIPSKGATTYTPGTTNQTIASGQYLSGTQTIAGDADLKAENIRSGVNLFGVTGTYSPSFTVPVDMLVPTGSTSVHSSDWAVTKDVPNGTYLVILTVSKSDGSQTDASADFNAGAYNGIAQGLLVTPLGTSLGRIANVSYYVVTIPWTWKTNWVLGRVVSNGYGPWNVLATFIKID